MLGQSEFLASTLLNLRTNQRKGVEQRQRAQEVTGSIAGTERGIAGTVRQIPWQQTPKLSPVQPQSKPGKRMDGPVSSKLRVSWLPLGRSVSTRLGLPWE